MQSNLKQGSVLILGLVGALLILAAVVVAVMFFGKNDTPSTALETSTVSAEAISVSDSMDEIVRELEYTSFDEIDSDLADTSKELASF